jgi:hypothetical protein
VRSLASGPIAVLDRIKVLFGRVFTPSVAFAPTAELAGTVAAALRARDRGAAAGEPGGTLVGDIHWLDELVPPDQEAKMGAIAALRKLLEGPAGAALDEDERGRLAPHVPPADLRPFGRDDLPASIARPFTERDGTRGRVVLAYFIPERPMWDTRLLARFARLVRGLPLPGGGTVDFHGPLLVWADLVGAIERDGPRAALAAFLVVVLLVGGTFRRLGATAAVLGALLAGTVVTAGLAAAVGERLNFLNFVAIPITLGVGVDYASNLIQRMRRDGAGGPEELLAGLRGTGGASALCSTTTVIGYASLLLADNQALQSFGRLCALGEVCTLATALTLVPAGAVVWFARRGGARPAGAP